MSSPFVITIILLPDSFFIHLCLCLRARVSAHFQLRFFITLLWGSEVDKNLHSEEGMKEGPHLLYFHSPPLAYLPPLMVIYIFSLFTGNINDLARAIFIPSPATKCTKSIYEARAAAPFSLS